MSSAANERDEDVTREDAKRIEEAHPREPGNRIATAEELNKPSDPSLKRDFEDGKRLTRE